MKTTELRIGNWYMSTKFQTPVICEMGDFYEIYARADGSSEYNVDDIFQPIPLTEEWLVKFGFKYQDRDVSHVNGKIERFWIIKWSTDGDSYGIEIDLIPRLHSNGFFWLNWDIGGGNNFVHLPHSCKLEYVHQLQNLYFALTGEELTLKTS